MADEKTIILKVALDEGKTEQRLQQLVLEMEATRKAQVLLTAERRAGTVADEDFAKRSSDLKLQLRTQGQETTALQKNLELYRRAVNGVAGSYDQAQAQLSLAKKQYDQLSGSADNSSESAQALTQVIDGLRNTLKATDAQQSLFVRNVGNYPDGKELTGLVQQLVRLEEQSKSLTEGTKEAAEAQRAIIGFRTAAIQTGAAEGKTYEQTAGFIKEYGDAIRPATVEVVKLAQEQKALADSADGASEQVQKIGFRMAQLEKGIKEVPAETKKLSAGLKEVASQNTLVSSATEKYTSVKDKFTQASNLAKLAIGGEVTALGLLRLAIIATGLGALVVVLGSVVTFLTKTAEGSRLVENVMAQVGATVNVVIDRFGAFGKAVTQVLSGDFSGAANTARGAFKGIGDEIQREVKIAGDLSKAQQQLDRDTANNIDTNKRLLNQVERLKNVRDNEFNTLAVRKQANEDAYKVELLRETTLTDLARRRITILKAQIDQRGGESRASLESLKEYKEAQNELSDIQEDAAGKQNELITNRFQLNKDGLDKEKEARAKALEKQLALRKEALALEALLLDRQLALTEANSEKELSLLQQKLRNGYLAELNVKGLTVAAKKVIDQKYENDSLKLSQDFNKQRTLAAYEAEMAATAAELTLVKKGTDAETQLRREAVDTQLRKELAALDQRNDNAAQEALLRANAAKALVDVDYGAALAQLDAFLDAQRRAVEESNARGALSEKQYNEAVTVSDQIAAGARLQLARDFKQDTTALERTAADAKIADIRRVTAAERIEQQKRVALAEQIGSGLAQLFADTVATTGATLQDFVGKALILIIDAMEKTIIAAQVKIIAEALATPQSAATFGVAGFAQAAATIAAVTVAAEVLKSQLTAPPKEFAGGGVLRGATHAQGGIPFTVNGVPGFEAEDQEILLTAGVWRSPVLRPMANALNIMGGGRPLVPGSFMALGGVASAAVRESMRGPAEDPINYDRLASALRKVNVKATITDVEAGLNRSQFTKQLTDS